MGITAKQRTSRKWLGSSDLWKLMTGNAWELWAERQHSTTPEERAWFESGNFLEPALWEFARSRLGKLRLNAARRVKKLPILCHIDAIAEDDRGNPAEGKTANIVSNFGEAREYGDEGTDEVPERVIVQCHGHMMATEKDVCHVPALIGGRGFLMFRVERNGELVEAIGEIATRFWTDHVLKKVPPDESWSRLCAPSLDVLKRVHREPGKIVPLADDAVELWQRAVAARQFMQKVETQFQARLLNELGDAEAGQLSDGSMVTFKPQRTGGLRTKDLRAAYPEIAKEFENTDTHRVMRIKKGPKGDRQLTSDND